MDLVERVADQPTGSQRRRDRIEREIDRALLIEMHRGEIEQRMAKDRLAQPWFPDQLGTEHGDGLQMGAAMAPQLKLAQERADILDEILESAGSVLALHRVH